MTDDPKQKVQINLRVPPELKAAAERAARTDSRSLTSLIEKLLRDHLKSIGVDPDEPTGDR